VNDATGTSVGGNVPGWRWWLRGILGVALGAGAIWLVFRAAGGLGDVGAALRQTNPWWLVPAAGFEGLSYLLAGDLLHWAMSVFGRDSGGMRRSDVRPVPAASSSAFKGFRFPPEVIVLAVRW
jgi:hypothetical protein